MQQSVQVQVGDEMVPFELDFASVPRGRWTCARDFPESYFPLTVDVENRRYELYSDGTFAEVER